LISEIAGVALSKRTVVSDAACQACCSRFAPTSTSLNPAVASVLHAFTDFVVKGEGIDGCDLEEGRRLRRFAQKFLDVMPGSVAPSKKINEARAVPCFFIGNQVGERPCRTCRGNVRFKVYECQHELHSETIIPECEACLDYDAQLAQNQVREWAVGVTTAHREVPTLGRSLESLERAGWGDYEVFAEPDAHLPGDLNKKRCHIRNETLGEWSNFYLALVEMMLQRPLADAYLMCQDDVVYSPGLRRYLEDELWPTSRSGVVSLHTPMHQDVESKRGFYPLQEGWAAWGAQALVFSNTAARAFVRHARIVDGRNREPRDGICHVDTMVGIWCRQVNLCYLLHSPSPTQHIGEASTVWESSQLEGRRLAATFLGEDVAIDQYMRSAKSPALSL